jgi:hypothetical protein
VRRLAKKVRQRNGVDETREVSNERWFNNLRVKSGAEDWLQGLRLKEKE